MTASVAVALLLILTIHAIICRCQESCEHQQREVVRDR